MQSRILPYLAVVMVAGALASSACTVHEARPARPAEAHAIRSGYTHLGERIVNGGVDHDVIAVGRDDGRFRELMLVVERAPVEIYDLVVTFGNGERYEPRTRLVFGPDSASRSIDLPGNARFIRRVDFRYANLVAGARAKVELWGR
jgi:hypothetical protein